MSNDDTRVTDAQLASLVENEGFFEKSKRQGLFFMLFDGTICLKSSEVPTEPGWETEPIETQNPRTKTPVFTYVKRFDKLICRIVDVNKRRKEFDGGGKITNWNFTIMAGTKKAVLQTVWMDRLLNKILKVGPNINFERPMIIGAFKKHKAGKDTQLISIRQGESANPDDWTAVAYYWVKPESSKGEVDFNAPAVGTDGSILPEVIHDEEDDTWDFKAQEKFLAQHFIQNTLPRIKAIAERMGIKADMVDHSESGTPEFSGPPVKDIPPVTTKPDNPVSTSVKDAMTPEQSTGLRRLAKQVGKDIDKLSQKFLDEDFDDLSIDAAAYLKYKIEKRIKKAREADPTAFPDPQEKSDIRKHVEKINKRAPIEDDDDDDDWTSDSAPANKKKTKSDDDDDDEDWGASDDNYIRDEAGNILF